MADYVKRKIVEKLARFTKDLKPSDISLSFLSGKGELCNLELDPLFITEVLQLPPWIQVTHVLCDKIKGRVPFTRLRSEPVTFYAGRVTIEVSTCRSEGPRDKKPDLLKKLGGGKPSKYGFTEKVIDGMRVEIRSIVVRFQDPTFHAQLDMTDIVIESTTSEWTSAPSLADTRHKIADEDAVVIFKMASWGSLKLEGWSASPDEAHDTQTKQHNARIRLISDRTKIKIALKRDLSNSLVMATRISVHLGDILWILTQSQLRAVSKLAQSLMEAAVQTAQTARHEQESQDSDQESVDSLESTTSTTSSELGGGRPVGKGAEAKVERKKKPSNKKSLTQRERLIKQRITDYRDGRKTVPQYEVTQDSFHLFSGKIELQLCDDTEQSHTAQGSMLLQLCKLVVDVYFDQPGGVGRAHWNEANDLTSNNAKWSRKLIQRASRTQFMDYPSIDLIKLRERGVVIKCSDFSVHALKTGLASSSNETLPVITCDKKTFCIPDDIYNPAFQVGLTFYHYPPEHSGKFSAPRPNVFIYFSPLHINVDQLSCLWLVEFVYGVVQTINMELAVSVHDEGKNFIEARKAKSVETYQLPGVDAKIKILFTKVTIPLPGEVVVEDGRPKALQVETAAIKVKNRMLESLLANTHFKNAIQGMKGGWVFETQDTNQFPHFSEDIHSLPSRLIELINQSFQHDGKRSGSSASPTSDQRLTSGEDVVRKLDLATMEGWHIHTECVHVAFADSYSHEATLYTTQFVDDFPVHLWLFPPRPDMDSTVTTSSPSQSPQPTTCSPDPVLSFVAHAPDVIRAELNRSQLLFLMRLKDSITIFKNRLMEFLDTSTLASLKRAASPSSEQKENVSSSSTSLAQDGEDTKSMSGCVIVEHVEANILLPSIFIDRKDRSIPSANAPLAGESDGERSSDSNDIATPSEISKHLTLPQALDSSSQADKTQQKLLSVSQGSLTSSQSEQVETSLAPSPLTSQASLSQTSSTDSLQAHDPASASQTSLINETGSVSSLPVTLEMKSTNSHNPRMCASASNIAAVQPPEAECQHTGSLSGALSDETVDSPVDFPSVDTQTTQNPSGTSSVACSTPVSVPSSSPSTYSVDEEFVMVNHPEPSVSSRTPSQLDIQVKVEVTPPLNEPIVAQKKRRVKSPPPLSERKVRSSTPPRNEPQYILCIKVDGVHALPNILTTGGITARCNANSIDVREVKKDKYESHKEESKFRRKPQHEQNIETCRHPVIKARIEIGDQAARFFPDTVSEADAILILKATGLEVGLLTQNMAVLKDFFDDEFEAEFPIPMHIRVDNTKLVILDSPGDEVDNWKSVCVEVNQADIHRGRSLAEGVNIFMDGGQGGDVQSERLSVAADEQESSSLQATELQSQELQQSNSQLLTSFQSFISKFEFHMKLHGFQSPPQPDHIAGVLAELQTSVVAQKADIEDKSQPPPPYSEAMSVMVTSHLQSVSGSNSEMIRLRRENEELRQLQLDRDKLNTQLVESQNKLEQHLTDLDMVTDECKKAKEELVVYKQVLEKQQEHLEKLLSENFDLRKKTGSV